MVGTITDEQLKHAVQLAECYLVSGDSPPIRADTTPTLARAVVALHERLYAAEAVSRGSSRRVADHQQGVSVMKIRLFEDDTELGNQLGQQIALACDHAMRDLIVRVVEIEPNVSMRDVEILATTKLQIAVARAILRPEGVKLDREIRNREHEREHHDATAELKAKIIELEQALDLAAGPHCSSCGNAIDPDTCWCGEGPKDSHDNHHFIPMGCNCSRAEQDWMKIASALRELLWQERVKNR